MFISQSNLNFYNISTFQVFYMNATELEDNSNTISAAQSGDEKSIHSIDILSWRRSIYLQCIVLNSHVVHKTDSLE